MSKQWYIRPSFGSSFGDEWGMKGWAEDFEGDFTEEEIHRFNEACHLFHITDVPDEKDDPVEAETFRRMMFNAIEWQLNERAGGSGEGLPKVEPGYKLLAEERIQLYESLGISLDEIRKWQEDERKALWDNWLTKRKK